MQEEPGTNGHSPFDPAGAAGTAGPDGFEVTGDTSVDEALRTLERLETQPVHEHPAVFEQVHRALQDRLADESANDSAEGQE
ncbi:hypothetical protein [Phytoactinopolyspora endophytica]|uniref:hypothetical protein n=1 Tax=Phytoactinopolyspora endophytica TaxID=1642495 RepID=UPI00101D9550|nr:hypothetical protein [Phytoactinopolyspora endophytica]